MSDGKRTFPSLVVATCLENTTFTTIEYGTIDISLLKCDKEVTLTTKLLNKQYCINEPSELMNVGFKLQTRLIVIFDVCINRTKNITHFIKHAIAKDISNVQRDDLLLESKSNNNLNCTKNIDNQCCFGKKQLISPEDILPGLQRIAAYSESNFFPQWSSCGTEVGYY